MGQEIFYCGVCKTLLRTRDLDKGAAVRHGDQVYCVGCAPAGAAKAAREETRSRLPAMPEPPKSTQDETRSRLAAIQTPRTPRAPQELPRKATSGVAIAGAVGAIVVLLLLGAFAVGGGAPRSTSRKEPIPAAVEVVAEAPKPPVARPETREPRPPAPKPVDREAGARKLLEEAKAIEDVDARFAAARRALLEADGTALAEEARTLEADARRRVKERDDKKRAELDAKVKAALAVEKFADALALLEAGKLSDAEARASLDAAWKDASEKLLAARRKGAEADVKAVQARVDAWGVAAMKDALAKELAQPVEVDLPAELAAYRRRWTELPVPLDYAALLKELEKGAPGAAKGEAATDLELVRLAAEVARELPKIAKGQELRLERYEDGARVEAAGKVFRAGPHAIVLWNGDELVPVALAELTPASTADLFRARAAKKPTDARAAQLYCLLEGDLEGAARHAGEPVPPGPTSYAARAAVELRSAAETEARKAFAEAEKAFHGGLSRLSSGPAYAALAKSPAAFARRAKPLLDERLAAAQEVLVGVEELTAAGLFAASEALKGVPSLTMGVDAPGRVAENYVQFELPVPGGDVPPRCWVYAGGCCLEVLSFGVQAVEFSGPNPRDPKETVSFEPGGAFAMPAKPSLSLKAKHGQHLGPKEPSKWAWASVPLPKYATAGARKVRIVSEQQGFSIAYVWAGVGRPGPAREADVKELEKDRAELEALRPPAAVQTGTLLREWWGNAPGYTMADVPTAPGFPDRPSGSGPIALFEGPTNTGDNYVTRIRGYVHPPQTGNYVFYVTSDDQAELWISTDETPARRRRLVVNGGAFAPRDFDHPQAPKSAPVALRAGKRYYVEFLHKEGGGQDNCAVGWALPDGALERPIPGNRLSPWVPRAPRAGGAFHRAINLNGPALVIDGRPFEGREAAQIWATGTLFENQGVPLDPPVADAAKAQMLRSAIFNREGLTITLKEPPGRYQVFLYIWEDNASQTFDILLNGKVVREKYMSGGAGHWERLGPWTAEAPDGTLEIKTTAADANVSGVEIWRAAR